MGKKNRINKNKASKKQEELQKKWEELEKWKEKKNRSLLAAIYMAVLLAFSILVKMTPAITHEGIRYVAGMIHSVSGVIWLGLGMSVYNYRNNRQSYEDLAKRLGVKNPKTSEKPTEHAQTQSGTEAVSETADHNCKSAHR